MIFTLQAPSSTVVPSPSPSDTASDVNATVPTPSVPAGSDGRASTFRAVEGGGETRSGELLVVEAYALIWMILMGWLIFLWRKQNALGTRLEDLEQAIDKTAAKLPK